MNKYLIKRLILTVVMVSVSFLSNAQTKIVGYLPSYQNIKLQVDKIDLSKITHLTLAFLHPDKQGIFINEGKPSCMHGPFNKPLESSEIDYGVQKAHQEGVKILISIGGASYPKCAGDWQRLLTPKNREKTIKGLLKFVDKYQLDGLDIDLEGKVLTSIDKQGDFLPFIKRLHTELTERKKLLTAATGSYVGGMLPEDSLKYFEYVSIMSYDAIGPTWGPSGVEHSTFAKAKADIKLWKKKGLTKEKLILGLPFYGYGFGEYNPNYGFIDLVSEFGDSKVTGDLIGKNCPGCSYISFNGYQTIKAKTELALKHGAGVMIWELSKDSPTNNSLLNAVDQTVKQKNNITH